MGTPTVEEFRPLRHIDDLRGLVQQIVEVQLLVVKLPVIKPAALEIPHGHTHGRAMVALIPVNARPIVVVHRDASEREGLSILLRPLVLEPAVEQLEKIWVQHCRFGVHVPAISGTNQPQSVAMHICAALRHDVESCLILPEGPLPEDFEGILRRELASALIYGRQQFLRQVVGDRARCIKLAQDTLLERIQFDTQALREVQGLRLAQESHLVETVLLEQCFGASQGLEFLWVRTIVPLAQYLVSIRYGLPRLDRHLAHGASHYTELPGLEIKKEVMCP
mmetsp:Transcript_49513/g.105887  ORF Transcript_49513/g.105887 Transcript_49513/m.105887 type:complete len:279 (+) Transcript_49513:251-1087(+)